MKQTWSPLKKKDNRAEGLLANWTNPIQMLLLVLAEMRRHKVTMMKIVNLILYLLLR